MYRSLQKLHPHHGDMCWRSKQEEEFLLGELSSVIRVKPCAQLSCEDGAGGGGSCGIKPSPCVPSLCSYLVSVLGPWGVSTAPQSQMGRGFLQVERQDCQCQDETSGPAGP